MVKLISILICFLLVLSSNRLWAGQSDGIEALTSPISKYMVNNEPLALRNVNGEYYINFPISDRIKPLSAILNVAVTNSNALKGDRSQVSIYVNEFIIGQIKLDSYNNNTEAKIHIDQEYLKHGYNKITFKVVQHYTDKECEDWSAPELWTLIDTVKSTLTINYEKIAVVEKISELSALINDRLDHYSFSILRGDQSVSDDYLYWGAVITQAVKLRLNYVPLTLDEHYLGPFNIDGVPNKFNINPDDLKNDAVLVGTIDQIAKLLPSTVKSAIQGPYLGIFQQDKEKHHFLLVISGKNEAEVKAAVQSFALLNTRLPDEQQTIINTIDIPSGIDNSDLKSILPGNTYQFSALDFQHLQKSFRNHHSKLDLHLPSDMYATEDSNVTLNLNLAYGAALRNDSVINIDLNGEFVHAIHLKEVDGAHYRHYQVLLPLKSFIPGLNTLDFKYVLTPSKTGECTYFQQENLVATIYGDSTVTFPEAGRLVTLPDLSLFKRTGFPIIKNSSAKDTAFKLLDVSSDTIESAWQLLANLTTNAKAPFFDFSITQGNIPEKENIVLIGKLTDSFTNQETLKKAPVKLGVQNQFPYQFKEHQTEQKESIPQWIERVFFGNLNTPKPIRIENRNSKLTQTGGLGSEYLLMSYPSEAGDGVVIALLSETDNSLNSGLSKLFSPGLWDQLKGNVFIWDKNNNYFWQQEGESIIVSNDDFRLSLIMHFSNYPWHWLAVVAFLLIFVAWVTHRLLKNYQSNHN